MYKKIKLIANLLIKNKNISRDICLDVLKQVNLEVDSRLKHSLHKQVFLVLDKIKNPGQIEQIKKFGEVVYKVGSELKSRLKNKEITTVFDQTDVNGRLLILGEPGSGKTTILLKLAEELVKRAQDDDNHPIPVLFSLSSWKKDNQSIKDWLVEQLKDKYGVRKDIGKDLVDKQKIIPLLDGLDEIAAERQELCVRKINDFLHSGTWSNPLVVCSRTEEYKHHETLLQLNNSLELCPFTPQQVYEYLQNTDDLQLQDSINNDAYLNKLAQTPLFLNIIVLSAQEISVETWLHLNSSEERLHYLFDSYIRRMLQQRFKGKQPMKEQTRKWLSWLAKRLIEEKETEFLIERMQPSWLKNSNQKSIYQTIVYLAFALILGFTGLSGALIILLLYGFTTEDNSRAIFRSLVAITFVLIVVHLIISPYLFVVSYPQEIIKLTYESTSSPSSYAIPSPSELGVLIPLIPNNRKSKKESNRKSKKESNRKSKKESNKDENITFLLGVFCVFFALIVSSLTSYYLFEISLFYHPRYWFEYEINHSLCLWISINLLGTFLGIYCLLRRPKIIHNIQVIETFKWSWLIAKKKILSVILFGIFYGVCAMVFYYLITRSIIISVPFSLEAALILVIGILFSGLVSSDIEVRIIPNQGIIASSVNAVTIGFAIGLMYGLIETLLSWVLSPTVGLTVLLIYALSSCLKGALMGALIGGGGACLKHFVLRLILYHYDCTPWNYANFLDYATNCLFLQRVGGSYRFMHDLLRQHFAKSYANSFEK